MHRSGTSALAGIATLLGATPPGNVMPAADDNPAGFWESEPIVILNQALLIVTGHNWYDCLTYASSDIPAAELEEVRRDMTRLLEQEFGAAPLTVVKDPRLSLVLHLWRPALRNCAALLCLRHPAEVAGSLMRRDRFPNDLALMLWLHYTLEAERNSRFAHRAIVSYDLMLRDWRATVRRAGQQAGIRWHQDPAMAQEDATRFIGPRLRHHFAAPDRITVGPPELRPLMAETWHVLRGAEGAGLDPGHMRTLDQIHARFAEWRLAKAPRVGLVPREPS